MMIRIRFLVALLAPLTTAALTGCENQSMAYSLDNHTIAATSMHDPVLGRPTLGMPIEIAGHRTRVIPFSVQTEKGFFERDDPYRRTRAMASVTSQRGWGEPVYSGVYAAGEVRWHNALLVDPKTGASRTLLGDRAVISGWAVYGPAVEVEKRVAEFLLFRVTGDDTDRDGELTNRDANRIVIATPDGSSIRVISPHNAQVWDVSYDAPSRVLYLKVVRDNSGDGAFTHDDVPEIYAWETMSPDPAQPLVSRDTVRELRGVLGSGR